MKYLAYSIFTTAVYLGEINASSLEDAKEKAELLAEELELDSHITLCHRCTEEAGDLNFKEVAVELAQ